jgi:MinD superfamily P-loop ATPase
MIIAVASGKGGTGKTTVSASLASVWTHPLTVVDLDVEAPNLHLFLTPQITGHAKALMEVPVVDESRCNYCRKCAELCQFKAIGVLGESAILTFPEMCHGCGGCVAICPENALSFGTRKLGDIAWGHADQIGFIKGELKVGEAMSPPLMREVKRKLMQMVDFKQQDVIIDAPPGVSCPAINAVMDSDVILMVTEPTPFGLFDLKLAHEAFSHLNIPMAVIINRAGLGNNDVYTYCADTHLPILSEIPYSREIAEAYADGILIADASPQYRKLFQQLAADSIKFALSPQEVTRV